MFITALYFIAAWGVSTTFTATFTFGSFNTTTESSVYVNSITTAPTKVPKAADVSRFVYLFLGGWLIERFFGISWRIRYVFGCSF